MRNLRFKPLTMVFMAFLSLFFAGRSHPAGPDISGERIFYDILSAHEGIDSLSGEFDQSIPLKELGITREARGNFYVKKPLKSRWDYVEPIKQVYIATGGFYFVKREGDGGFRKSRMEPGLMDIYNVLLGAGGRLDGLFEPGRVSRLGESTVELELIPLDKYRKSVKRVVVHWNSKVRQVEGLTIFLLTGATNRLCFKNVVVNGNLPESLFLPTRIDP